LGAVLGLTNGLGAINAGLLAFGRWLGAGCVALMVVIILVQVFFRYMLDDALAWPEEAARFLMLWMTGLMAPTAFQRGSFVSIDMLVRVLPRSSAAVLSLMLLLLSLAVLIVGLRIGWSEVTGLGGRFTTDSLSVPSFGFSTWTKVPKSWMMASLVVGIGLLISVCVELILRVCATLLGAGDRLIPILEHATMANE
jgi:TRAP-type C4-dicarboxylate transport system permease small subunit